MMKCDRDPFYDFIYVVGDVARLVSGGPALTVMDVRDDPTAGAVIDVQWFAGSGLSVGAFPVACLTRRADENPRLAAALVPRT